MIVDPVTELFLSEEFCRAWGVVSFTLRKQNHKN